MKKGLGISGMKRPLLGVTPVATAATEVATPMARRGIAISGMGRRLGISGMNRPLVSPPAVTTDAPTVETDGEILP